VPDAEADQLRDAREAPRTGIVQRADLGGGVEQQPGPCTQIERAEQLLDALVLRVGGQ
jgi:hypothetical protein